MPHEDIGTIGRDIGNAGRLGWAPLRAGVVWLRELVVIAGDAAGAVSSGVGCLTGIVDMDDLLKVMTALAVDRPVFHSEADFQHAFACALQRANPDARIRLETRPARGEHLDVLFSEGDCQVAIELKYLTAAWAGPAVGESFELLSHGAQDIRAYDCVKDIVRIERYTTATPDSSGLVVVLANDASYWRPVAHGRLTNADAFRIREGAVLHGDHGWGPNAGSGTMHGREASLRLVGTYTCRGRDYSRLDGRNGLFRYLAFRVPPLEA